MKINDIDIKNYETILLDRDGTINVHIIGDYVRSWDDFEFIPNVVNTIAKWSKQLKHIFIVTNQRGIGKEEYTIEDLTDIHSHMVEEIEKKGGRIDKIYFCTSLTDEDVRRKPGRGMFDDILRDYPDINPSKTLMIGDSDVDCEFAKNIGVDFVRIDSLKRQGDKKYWVLS